MSGCLALGAGGVGDLAIGADHRRCRGQHHRHRHQRPHQPDEQEAAGFAEVATGVRHSAKNRPAQSGTGRSGSQRSSESPGPLSAGKPSCAVPIAIAASAAQDKTMASATTRLTIARGRRVAMRCKLGRRRRDGRNRVFSSAMSVRWAQSPRCPGGRPRRLCSMNSSVAPAWNGLARNRRNRRSWSPAPGRPG